MKKIKLNNKLALVSMNILIILILQSCKPETNKKTTKTSSTSTSTSTSTTTPTTTTPVTTPTTDSSTVDQAPGHGVANLDSNQYISWLVKSVCVDSIGTVVAVDPYGGCPSGNTIRKIKAGDPLPYNNIEQLHYQMNDSFFLLDTKGANVPMHTFDYAPFNEFNQHSGSDGYDVYSISSTHVSVSSTKDGGGYSSTFFSPGCTIGNGWVLFPITAPTKTAEIFAPIASTYWEHAGLSYPGSCPKKYSSNSLTSWSLKSDHVFGGKNGNSEKKMDTIISFHGYEDSSSFLQQGHLEVFYYTREYGLTRWEVWKPVEQGVAPASTAECNGETSRTYKNKKFTIYWCHDWSVVRPLSVAKILQWPIPSANHLKFFHFEGGLDSVWQRFGKSPAGNLINWEFAASSASTDAEFGGNLRYMKMNCGAGGDGKCNGGQQAVYQDVAFSEFTAGATYFYGVNARTEAGTGTFHLGVQVVNSSGAVIFQDISAATVKENNGDGRSGEAASIYRSVAFYSKNFIMPSNLVNAKFVRFIILPSTPHTFYLSDVWLNRIPVLNTMLKNP